MAEPETNSTAMTLLVIGLFALIFPLFWCGVIWLLSVVSGWQRLASRYRAHQPVTGQMWNWQYGMMGWIGYNGVLQLTANAEGLFIETFWLFAFGQPRLFIPWQDFHNAEVGDFFFRRQVKAQIGAPPLATVRLPAAVFEQSEGRKVLVS